ncbi:MAG: glycoside hydrolase family 2 TIM barrel-domain containing protein [Dysgonomonas sp.]
MRSSFFKTALLFQLLFLSIIASAQRQEKTINDGWRFMQQDIKGAEQTGFNDKQWESISVPHSWNSDAYTAKNYYRGKAWYRKTLFIPQTESNKQLFIRWEGVNHSASVYINGQFAGEHKGGYTSFTIDITPYCKFGEDNIIAIKADNRLNDVPPISGDFTIFGGMYRDVWLIATPKQHIDLSNKGSNGIFIETKNVSEKSSDYIIRGSVVNESISKASVKVASTIKDISGKTVKVLTRTISFKGKEQKAFSFEGTIADPMLWSPENPNLYTVETIVTDTKTNVVLDAVNSYTGFRWFSFDGEKGFFLNGKPYKLRGVCRHQDQKPLANALSDEMHRRDMHLIKDMGANFIRISHYPQDPAVIEQCDRMGLLVWEEIPVIDIVPESAEFADVCESVLREMIRQHYNHPSVIMWGYMNEILLVTQRRYKGEELTTATNRALDLAKRLEKVLKEEDPSRYSVMAFHGSQSYNDAGFGNITDIVGWNLYQGWYSDNFSQFDQFLKKQQELYPNTPKIVSEYGAGSDKRIHSLEPKRFDFSIEYHQLYAEHYLNTIEREPYIAGATYWNFIDFGSAQRDESMPRINNKGLVYADRTPKDVYYLFKAYFREDVPVLHIASHDWLNRTGESLQSIKVYSNLDQVELFLDGKSMNVKQIVDKKAEWQLSLTPGVHYVSAKGKYKGENIETGINITFEETPDVANLGNKELAINVGSKTYFTSAESDLTWVPDKEYTSGSWGYIGGESSSTQTEITGTTDNPLYQTLRVSPDMYRFDVQNGQYEVELLFADIFQTRNVAAHLLGAESQGGDLQNIFDVVINGQKVDTSLNLAYTSGYYIAAKKKYIVNVNDNSIILQLAPISGKAFLNGIKLRKL